MIQTGFVGGRAAQLLLRRLGREASQELGHCNGAAYAGRSKLDALFGPGIHAEVCGKRVLDFGCGDGVEAVEMAERGADVVGVDIRPRLLESARISAEKAGVSSRCRFSDEPDGRFDAVFSIDGFEHYDDPAGVLRLLRGLLRPGGRVYAAFGPPWFHPFGGHLFSVFPWAHLIFTEQALLRWRSGFKSDGARRFHEVEGGLNQMTVARFKRLVAASGLHIDYLELVPVHRLRRFFNPLTREFFTSVVRCELVKDRGLVSGRAAG